MITLLAIGALAWDLQSPYNKPTVAQYAVTIQADVDAEQHEAVFTFRVESKKSSGESVPVEIGWTDLLVDGNSVGESPTWNGVMDLRGQLTSVEADSDDYRRMLTPMLFAWPNKAIEEKAKFEATWLKADQPFAPTFAAEAQSVEKVNDKDLLKVTTKFAEKGDQGIRADGTWWFDASGKLVKFVVEAKNWVVPMAGSELVSAKIVGNAK